MAKSEWTLSEAARLPGEPQHRLIYLCEKRVIVPDFGEAHGRGSSRRFSARNMLEFALALKLRQVMIPVAPVAAIIHVLRVFERKVMEEIPTFRLPQSLLAREAPEFRIIISDGQRLFFSLRRGKGTPRLYGGLDFSALTPTKRDESSMHEALIPLTSDGWNSDDSSHPPLEDREDEANDRVRIVLNVTRIAQDLNLEN